MEKEPHRPPVSGFFRNMWQALQGTGGTIPSGVNTQDGLLFRVCTYIGNRQGFFVEHPCRHASVPKEDRQDWMDVLTDYSPIAMRKVELQQNWWQSFHDPFVVFQDEKPLAAIPKQGMSSPYLFDVESFEKSPLNKASAASLEGTAYVFYEALPACISTVSGLFSFGLRSIKNNVWPLIALLSLLAVIRLFLPIANQLMFDLVIPTANTTLFWQLVFGLAVMVSVEFILSIVRGYSILRLQIMFENKVQTALWERLLNLLLSAFRRFTESDLFDRVSLAEKIRPYFAGRIIYTLCDAPFSLFFAPLMLWYSWELGLFALAALTFFCCLAGALRKKIQPLISESIDMETEQAEFMRQVATGIETVRLAAAETRVFEQWADRFHTLGQLKLLIRTKEKYFVLIKSLFVILSLGLIYGVVAYHLSATGQLPFSLTMGKFIGFQTAFFLLASTISQLLEFMPFYMRIVRSCAKTDALLAYPLEQIGHKHYQEKLTGDIRVDNLTFQYPGTSAATFSAISFACAPGAFVGIMGRSGSGKSTILRCLIGLEVPASGGIYYDGHHIKDLNLNSVRRRIGAVMQDSHIFMGNVKGNLLMGRSASRAAIDRAIELSCFDEVLRKLPMGLKTYVGSGSSNVFSGGELQRLLIARALICDIDILILDEATTALDAMTQTKVMGNLASLNITRIVVAHRLETIRDADQILVIKDGRIVSYKTGE